MWQPWPCTDATLGKPVHRSHRTPHGAVAWVVELEVVGPQVAIPRLDVPDPQTSQPRSPGYGLLAPPGTPSNSSG
eukprot:11184744-Lingulodinium_polyedra.AAC.1